MKSIFTLLFLMTAAVCAAEDHIVIVLDTSASMFDVMRHSSQHRRIDVAKHALSTVLTGLPPTTEVGIITFNGWLKPIGPIDEKTIPLIQGINVNGGTPLYQFIRAGATELLKKRSENGNIGLYKLLVVTDGEAGRDDLPLNNTSLYPDGTTKPGVMDDIIRRGVVIDAIGLDMPGNHAIAKQVNGSYMRGDDSAGLAQAIRKAVAEISLTDSVHSSEDYFQEIQRLPEGFCSVVIQGLTQYENQPIGEKPPIPATEASNSTNTPAETVPVSTVVPDEASHSGGTAVMVVIGTIFGVIAVFFLFMKILS